MFFQWFIMRFVIVYVISTACFLSGFLLITITGTQFLKNEEKIVNSKFFILIGIVNIFWTISGMTLSIFIWNISGVVYEIFLLMLFIIIPGALGIGTFGILFILLGLRNKQNMGNFLFFAGISYCVGAGFLMIIQSLNLFLPATDLIIFGIIGTIFILSSQGLFTAYSFMIKEKFFVIAGIFLLAGTLSAFYELVFLCHA